MTSGSVRTSSGVPCLMSRAEVERRDAVADAEDEVRVVLDQQDAEPGIAHDLDDAAEMLDLRRPSGRPPARRAGGSAAASQARGRSPGSAARHVRAGWRGGGWRGRARRRGRSSSRAGANSRSSRLARRGSERAVSRKLDPGIAPGAQHRVVEHGQRSAGAAASGRCARCRGARRCLDAQSGTGPRRRGDLALRRLGSSRTAG